MTDHDNDKTQAFAALSKGSMVSHYKIVKKVGAGGMGEVYLAEDTKLKRQVALKFISFNALDTPDAKTRFINEARAAARLDHPNICQVYEIDEYKGRAYIAIAYVDGQNLREKIQAGPLKLKEVVSLGIDITQGLQEAHENNIIHRDIKSANIIISSKGQGKITDFGLAKLVDGSQLTKTGTTMGTAAYMSPEQVRGEKVDRRTDIWSLGIILYEMISGRMPFEGDSGHAITHQIIQDNAEPITALRSGVPMELERIINKCMAKDAANRYQHADDLLVDLRNVDKLSAVVKKQKKSFNYLMPISIIVLAAAAYFIIPLLKTSNTQQVFENPLADASFRKITILEASNDAAISPDGNYIAFVSDHEDEFDIWVAQVETGNVFNRTKGQYGDMRRALQDVGFNAHSSEILSFSISNDVPLRSMPLFDGPIRKILRDSVIMANWSHDKKYVSYFKDRAGDPVFVANSDGTNSTEILSADTGMHQHYQRWSPNGEWIYMTRGLDNVWATDLWRIKPDGSQLEKITEKQLDVTFPTPISDRIVLFIARDEDGSGPWIWAVDVETKLTRKASIGVAKYHSLSASQDGKRIAAASINPEANMQKIWRVPILETIARESEVSQYELPTKRAIAPRVSNNTIYFLSSKGTGEGLWKYSDGQLTEIWQGSKSSLFNAPAISSDGRSITISLKNEGVQNLYLIDSDGSNLRLLNDNVEIRGSGSFSPDGQSVVVGGEDNIGVGLFIISVVDGHSEKIIEEDALNPIWSPKGDLIIYSGKQVSGFSNIEAVRTDGTKFELPEIKTWVRGERFRFMPDGSGFVYMKGWMAGQDFYLFDLVSMETRRLTNIAKGAMMRTFDISADGSEIFFDRLKVKTEIVLIELPDENPAE